MEDGAQEQRAETPPSLILKLKIPKPAQNTIKIKLNPRKRRKEIVESDSEDDAKDTEPAVEPAKTEQSQKSVEPEIDLNKNMGHVINISNADSTHVQKKTRSNVPSTQDAAKSKLKNEPKITKVVEKHVVEKHVSKEPSRPQLQKKAREGTQEVWNLIESLDAPASVQSPAMTQSISNTIDNASKKPSYEEIIRREQEEQKRRQADERARLAEQMALHEMTMEMIEQKRESTRKERIQQRDSTDFSDINTRFERANMSSFEKQWKNPLRYRKKDMIAFYNTQFPITQSPFENFKLLWNMREEHIRKSNPPPPPPLEVLSLSDQEPPTLDESQKNLNIEDNHDE